MMGFGASSLILGNVANALINNLGWRSCYLIIGGGILAVLVCGSVLMVPFEKVEESRSQQSG